jgi:hypothetical protein
MLREVELLLILLYEQLRSVDIFCSLWLLYRNRSVICEVFTVESVKIMVLRNVTPCSLLDGYKHFGATCCLHLQVVAWRWSHHMPLAHWYPSTIWHSVTYLKIIIITIPHFFLCLGLSVLMWDYIWVLVTFEVKRKLDGKKIWWVLISF